jgi:hypothetical protein
VIHNATVAVNDETVGRCFRAEHIREQITYILGDRKSYSMAFACATISSRDSLANAEVFIQR